MNIHTTSSTKNIPQFPNHRIVEYKTLHWTDNSGEEHTAFEPVYKRIVDVLDVYWYKDQRVFLVNDLGKAYTCEGEIIEVNISELEYLEYEPDKTMFHSLLKQYGYQIVKGELVQLQYYFPLYTIDYGFIVAQCQYKDPNYLRFKSWGEVFENKTDCIKWCNKINGFLCRNYPEITE